MQHLNAVDGKGQAEQVVGEPVLLHDVPDANAGRQSQANLVTQFTFIQREHEIKSKWLSLLLHVLR